MRRLLGGLLLVVVGLLHAAQLYAVCVCPPFCPYDSIGNYVRQEVTLDQGGMMCWYDDEHLYTAMGCN